MHKLISEIISAANGSDFSEVDKIYKAIVATDDAELIKCADELLKVI